MAAAVSSGSTALVDGLSPNDLKSWEFDKEAPQNFCPE